MAAPNAKGSPTAERAEGDPEGLFPDEAILSRTFINRAQEFSHSLAASLAAIDPLALAIVGALVMGVRI